jgi:uncharacterized oxidoreductase
MKMNGNTILITGGGSGVGLALAKALFHLNNQVIITGRDEVKLIHAQRTCPGLHVRKCDIRREADAKNLAADIKAEFPGMNVLINNAGVAYVSHIRDARFYETTVDEMETNYLAPLRLALLFLDVLGAQPESAIINVGSPAAILPMAPLLGYSASKAALHSLSQSLREQLKDTRIRVIETWLPPVDTRMVDRFHVKKQSPDHIAVALIRELKKDRSFLPVGQVKILLWLSRFFPRLTKTLVDKLVASL